MDDMVAFLGQIKGPRIVARWVDEFQTDSIAVDARARAARYQGAAANTLFAVQTPLSDQPRIHGPAVSHVRLVFERASG